jgi:chromosome segregation ATPase
VAEFRLISEFKRLPASSFMTDAKSLDAAIAKLTREIGDLELAVLSASAGSERPKDAAKRRQMEEWERILKGYKSILLQCGQSDSSPAETTRECFEDFESTASDLKQHRDQLHDDIETLQDQLDKAERRRARRQKRLESHRLILKTQLGEFSEYLLRLRKKVVAKQRELMGLARDFKLELQQQLEESQNELQARIASLTEKENDLASKLKRQQKENRREAARQEAEREEREAEAAAARKRRSKVAATIADNETQIEQLREGVQVFEGHVRNLRKPKFSVGGLKSANGQLQGMLDRLADYQATVERAPRVEPVARLNDGRVWFKRSREMEDYGSMRKRALATLDDPAELPYLKRGGDWLAAEFQRLTGALAKTQRETTEKIKQSNQQLDARKVTMRNVLRRRTTQQQMKPS